MGPGEENRTTKSDGEASVNTLVMMGKRGAGSFNVARVKGSTSISLAERGVCDLVLGILLSSRPSDRARQEAGGIEECIV